MIAEANLPDHLPNILTLLPKMQDADLAEELICSSVDTGL